MTDVDTCQHCGASQRGDEIPEDHRRPGGATHYSRTILIEIPEEYDGGLYHMCRDCGGAWHRWPADHYLHGRAEKYIALANMNRENIS